MRAIRSLAAIFCVAAASMAAAQDGLTKLVTGDDGRGWEAVGRLDVGGRGFCTATLIAPDRVLTAAHCLFDPDTGARVADTAITFRAGWRNSRANAEALVRRSAIHPDYRFTGAANSDSVWNDVAVLELVRPIRKTSVTPFDLGKRPRKGSPVSVVSYAHDRSEHPSLEEDCDILARPMGALILSCSVDFGSSGAPIFAYRDGVPEIVSVVSAKADIRGRPVSLGTGLSKPLEPVLALLEAESDGVLTRAPQPVRRIDLGGTGSARTGAKFVRP